MYADEMQKRTLLPGASTKSVVKVSKIEGPRRSGEALGALLYADTFPDGLA